MNMVILFFIGIIGSVILFVHMWLQARENNLRNLTLSFDQLPVSLHGFSIFFITDIHRRIIDGQMIEKVKGRADIVIIGGDLTESGVPLKQTKENLQRLNELGPIYFIWGNNDYEIPPGDLMDLFSKYNVTVLENHHVVLRSEQGEQIFVIGIGETSFGYDRLELALKGIPKETFKIVVCHNPEIVSKISERHNISLILCGHTHGGQIRPFGLGLYPKGKLYHLSKGDLLISNGYGTTKLPLRLGANPETHLICLNRK